MVKIVENYVDRYIKRYHHEIKRVCEPLTTCFGINYFTYHSLTAEGAWRPLVSRPDWADFYTENQCYLIDPCLLHPKNYQTGTLFWAHHVETPEQKEIIQLSIERFDMAHGFCLVVRSESCCEFFGFAAPLHHEKIYSTYMHDLPLLKKFCAFFKKELAPVFKMMDGDPIDVGSLKGQAFIPAVSPIISASSPQSSFLRFIQAEPLVNLSKREKQCLSLYLDEMQMKEVAQKLDLSVRTIEFYLNNIKNKLGCSTKLELIKKGYELRSLRLLQ